jgi:hypothetical protein
MPSSLKDNRPARGSVGEFLRSQIEPGTKLSFVSAYFTLDGYDALKPKLEAADHLRFRFRFGEPSFISEIDSDKHTKKNFRLTEDRLDLAHALACALYGLTPEEIAIAEGTAQ